MRTVMRVRLLLAVAAVTVWGYGYRVDDSGVRLAGIALLLMVLALRFATKKPDDRTPQ